VSPRPYRLSPSREEATSENRRRILAAARDLLVRPGAPSLTIDAVARAADVARMTVYNQFGSKKGLVEALSDELAERGGIGRLPEAFRAPDAGAGIRVFIEVFTGFWASDTTLIRRLRALTVLDPELNRTARDPRRRHALDQLLRRHAAETGRPAPADREAAIDLLLALTSFETYEVLSFNRSPEAVSAILTYTAGRLLS
jgi:AcrR family transcriptional regulator